MEQGRAVVHKMGQGRAGQGGVGQGMAVGHSTQCHLLGA